MIKSLEKKMKFLIIILLLNTINAEFSSWSSLIKKRNNNQFDLDENETNKCQMHIDTETIMSMKRDVTTAYAGNGFGYEIGCSVVDPNIKLGDKYYVIDLIVYGPNTRVAKAWREQFSTTTISQTRSLILNKSLSFHWLGINNIVCSVSKYNNLVNKFTRVCQTSSKINVVEKSLDDKLVQQQQKQPQNDLLKIASMHRQLWSTTRSTSLLSAISISKTTGEDVRTTTKEFNSNEKTNLLKNSNETLKVEEQNKSELTNSSLISLNLSAKAMQYRDLNEVSDKKLIINSQMSQYDKPAVRHFIQPLTVLVVFLVVFAVTIATLIYSTYQQKASKQYQAVNVNADTSKQHNDLDDDTNLDSIKISDSKSSHISDSDTHGSLNTKSNSKDAFSIDEISSID